MRDQVEFVENLYRAFEGTESHDKVRFAAWCLHRATMLPVTSGIDTDELSRAADVLWDGDDPAADGQVIVVKPLFSVDEDAQAIADELTESLQDARQALVANDAEAAACCAEHNLTILTFATYPDHQKVVEKEMADQKKTADAIIAAEAVTIDYLAPQTEA